MDIKEKTINHALCTEDVRIEVGEDSNSLRVLVYGAPIAVVPLSDAEKLLKAISEAILTPFNVEGAFDIEAARRVKIKRHLRCLGILERVQPSTYSKQECESVK